MWLRRKCRTIERYVVADGRVVEVGVNFGTGVTGGLHAQSEEVGHAVEGVLLVGSLVDEDGEAADLEGCAVGSGGSRALAGG